MASSFQPSTRTYAACLAELKEVRKRTGIADGKIITSKDETVRQALDQLQASNIPGGFSKYQIPAFFEGGPGALFFVSVGAPGTEVPKHSHDEGDGLRFIIAGSIHYEGVELMAGDWMFIPKGMPYSFKVGVNGVTAFYCYQCCCR